MIELLEYCIFLALATLFFKGVLCFISVIIRGDSK